MGDDTPMAEPVKSTRTYTSPRRAEQAAATRAAILDAATRLFLRDGYAATTMAAIAAEARVAVKTVYLAYETKAGLLRAAWNAGLRGGDGDAPVAQRAWYREVLDEPDPERRLRLNARNSRQGKQRIGALAEVIRTAAPQDRDIAALWERIGAEYHANQLAIAERLATDGALRPGLDATRAADLLWTINHPHTWHLLVGERGWTPEEYERWVAETSIAQLLGGGA
jgi:AcrR family transcriptional regulator